AGAVVLDKCWAGTLDEPSPPRGGRCTSWRTAASTPVVVHLSRTIRRGLLVEPGLHEQFACNSQPGSCACDVLGDERRQFAWGSRFRVSGHWAMADDLGLCGSGRRSCAPDAPPDA